MEILAKSTGNLTAGLTSLLGTLNRHGLNGSHYTAKFANGNLIYSQDGYRILVTRQNDSILLNDAKIVGRDFIAANGAVHALDRVR